MPRNVKSRDVNPQLLRGTLTQAAANTFIEGRFRTPNITEAGYVMEILKIFMEVRLQDVADGDQVFLALYGNSRTARPYYGNSGVLMKWTIRIIQDTTGAAIVPYQSDPMDLTDGNGNGVIYAGKELFFCIEGVSQTAAVIADFMVLYRLKKVSAEELLGALQS